MVRCDPSECADWPGGTLDSQPEPLSQPGPVQHRCDWHVVCVLTPKARINLD